MISVIMGIYNQKEREQLEQAVDSILNQTFREFEFLIYDDGSGKEDAEFLEILARKDDRIRLLRGQSNQGLAHALNECLHQAKGEYIARMDGDDISSPERFHRQFDFLETHSQYAFVGSSAILFDAEGIWGYRKMVEQPGEKEFLKYSPYVHPSVMFRRDALEVAGGYLETEDTRRCEDYELFMRLHCMGLRGYNIDEKLFSYRENRKHYDKRNFAQRVAEMKIRYRGFRSMGILKINTWIYVVKPVVMLLIPDAVRRAIRERQSK